MYLNLVLPKNILATLKREEPDNVSNIRQVYNIWYHNNKAVRGDRNEMQQLLKLLDDNKYVSRYRTCDDEVTVREIFWTHPDLIKLFNTFPTMLFLDSTYKTNKYRLSLFEVVGVTSTEKTYDVGFAFLECEKEDNFRWALEVRRSLLKEQVEKSKAVVTDSDPMLMDAVTKYPGLLKYVESTILDKVKEKFVCVWTDNVRHLGNTTTNRVESTHASLKNWLANNTGDLCRDWDTVNLMIKNQYNEIQTTFGRSITLLEHRFRDNILYSQLIGNMSRSGLNYIFHEAKQDETVGSDSAKCGCIIIKTYISSVLVLLLKRRKVEYLYYFRIGSDKREVFEVDDNMKLHIKEQLRKIGYPETTDMKQPSQPIKTKGASKKLKPTPNDNSTTRAPLYCEHVDKLFPDSSTPKSQKS
ncbi:uncharacterized protein LOC131619338 [Vicia villosa]|uniref:uncharacterized protein LOC131619338 n=1 Tax=Vicia villosa TaxID=3911 RepID=UPI00273C7AFD|nr:uncharacterized protein LOC131619338 [Vicia villosa]